MQILEILDVFGNLHTIFLFHKSARDTELKITPIYPISLDYCFTLMTPLLLDRGSFCDVHPRPCEPTTPVVTRGVRPASFPGAIAPRYVGKFFPWKLYVKQPVPACFLQYLYTLILACQAS